MRRFLNLCARQEIYLWDICETGQEDEFTCYLYKSDIYALKPFLRKTGTRFRICQKKGIGFWLFRYRKRGMFLLAFLLMSILLAYNSGFVWKIEIKGNSALSEDTIISYLKSQDCAFGAKKNDIDCDKLKLSLRKDFSEVIWASVYIEGTKLVVELQENLVSVNQTYAEDEKDTCFDLVAAKDATITHMVTRNGVPLAGIGDEVKAGDLLVSGRQEILDDNGEVGSLYYASADADILGIVTYEYAKEFPKTEALQLPTGAVKETYFAELYGSRFVLPVFGGDFEQYRQLEEYEQLHLSDNFYLPFFWGKITYEEYEQKQVTYRVDEIKQTASADFEQFLMDLEENGVTILDKNVMMIEKKNSYLLTGTVTASEPIARSVPTERTESAGQETEDQDHE